MSYADLLHAAQALGRADGRLAADLEPLERAGPSGACCQGRDLANVARHLRTVPGGAPPVGPKVNASPWYARGFKEALAEASANR